MSAYYSYTYQLIQCLGSVQVLHQQILLKLGPPSISKISTGSDQGCRKLAPLAPLAPPVPDKSHLVGQNEILKKKILDIL